MRLSTFLKEKILSSILVIFISSFTFLLLFVLKVDLYAIIFLAIINISAYVLVVA